MFIKCEIFAKDHLIKPYLILFHAKLYMSEMKINHFGSTNIKNDRQATQYTQKVQTNWRSMLLE